MSLPALKLDHEPVVENQVVNFQSQAVIKEAAAPKRAELPTKQRVIANERLMFVREVWNLIQRGNTEADAVAAVATRTESFPTLLTAGKGGKSTLTQFNYRSWRDKLGKYRGKPNFKNIDALVNRYGLNVRGAKGNPVFWKVFNSLFLNENKLSTPKAYAFAERVCHKDGVYDIPSLRQVRYWLDTHMDPAALLLARHGETWAENNLVSYIRRDWTEAEPNEVWIGDHHELDIFARAFNEEKERWEAVRPWLTAWMDAKSLRVTGVCIGFDEPNSTSIMTALQNGIRLNHNTAPNMLYSDRGKDFLKIGFTQPFVPKDTEHRHCVCEELGVKIIRSIAYRARAKTVERIFKEICEGFSKTWAAYLGNRPDARPEISGAFLKEPQMLPSLNEICVALAEWVAEFYHCKPQHGRILDGKSPDQAWNKGTGGVHLSDRDLWFSMLLPYTKNCPKVGRGAAVSVDTVEYRADELWPFFGKKVMVKFDVVNQGPPVAFTLDGKVIGPLGSVDSAPAIAKTDEGRKLVGEGMKRQRREMKRLYGIIDEETNGMWKLAPQETLALNPGEPVEIIKHDFKRKSVKGATHNYILHTTKPNPPVAPVTENEVQDTTRELTRGEEKQQKLLELDEFIKRDQTNDGNPDPDQISDFQNMVINKRRHNEHEDCW